MSDHDSCPRPADELGAHLSAAGGVANVPGRARETGAAVFQLFTKQPSRWAEPSIAGAAAERFREGTAALRSEAGARAATPASAPRRGIGFTASHDSYLINLASPQADLRRRSAESFAKELSRAAQLGLDAVVTHPGNATDGDSSGGIERNAAGVAAALEGAPGRTRVLLELTAGAGTSVGGAFEELAAIIDLIPEPHRSRVGVCFDTCHAWVGGYDLRGDFDGVWMRADDAFGLHRIELFHVNDARAPFGSRLDRHENIGAGTMGLQPFRRLMNSSRFRNVPKILETPKGDDPVAADRMNLAVLRGLREDG